MSGWEAEVLFPVRVYGVGVRLESNVKEFIEGVSVGEPCCAFLFCAEQVAVMVEGEGDGEADTGADGFAGGEVRGDSLDGAAIAVEVIRGDSVVIDLPRVGKICGTESKVEAAIGCECESSGIDILWNFLPTFSDNDFLVCLVVCIGICDEGDASFGGDKESAPAGVIGGCEHNTDRAAEAAGIFVEDIGVIFESIAVGVFEEEHIAVVAECDEGSIIAIAEVIYIGNEEGQFADIEAGYEHLDGGWIVSKFEWNAGCGRKIERVWEVGGELAIFLFEGLPELLGFGGSEDSVIDEEFCDISGEFPADLLSTGSIGVVAGSECELFEGECTGLEGSLAFGFAVDCELYAAGCAIDGGFDDLQRSKWGGRVLQVLCTAEATAFNIQLFEGAGGAWSEIEGEARFVIACVTGICCEEPAEVTGVIVGCGDDEDGC